MHSIRTKLAVFFSVVMVIVIVVGFLSNVLFLDKYYIYKNRSTFERVSNSIATKWKQREPDFANYLTVVERLDGISSIVADENWHVRFFSKKGNKQQAKVPKEIKGFIQANLDELSNAPIYGSTKKMMAQEPTVVFVKKLDDAQYLILRKPMKGIAESAAIANEFFLWSGIVMIGLGGVILWLFARKLTDPILGMSATANHIAHLNFEKKVAYKHKDEIGNLAESINEMAEKLSENMIALKNDVERRKALVRNLSHELKTPIGVIKGYTEGLQFGVAANDAKRSEYLQVIADECNRMDELVRELLSLSLVESGAVNMQQDRIDLKVLIQRTLERFQYQISEKEIRVGFLDDCDGQNVVVGDERFLQRVLDNYISNAIRHASGEKVVKIGITKRQQRIRIEVYNAGDPIPESELMQIWEVFYIADKARTREYGGHGLGLSIVKMIGEMMDAEVGVRNEGNGVTFYFEFQN